MDREIERLVKIFFLWQCFSRDSQWRRQAESYTREHKGRMTEYFMETVEEAAVYTKK